MSIFNFLIPDAPPPASASVPAPGKQNHVVIALSRLLQQWRDKPKVIQLVTALATQTQSLEDAWWDLLVLRQVDTATGVTLDLIGKIVGQPRNGLDDTDYRRYIRARIATNRSQGVVENLIGIAKLILNDLTQLITVERNGSGLGAAAVVVRVTPGPIDNTLAGILITFLRLAKSGGVKLVLETMPDVEAETFYTERLTFATGATSIGGTSMPALTTGFPSSGSIDVDLAGNLETVAYLATTPTAFQLTTPLTKNHASGVQILGSGAAAPAGKGLGDSANGGQPTLTPYGATGTTGGKMIDARE